MGFQKRIKKLLKDLKIKLHLGKSKAGDVIQVTNKKVKINNTPEMTARLPLSVNSDGLSIATWGTVIKA